MTQLSAVGALLAGSHPASKMEPAFADISVPAWAWFATLGLIVLLLMLDILVLHRTPKVLTSRRAALETLMWVAVGVSFGVAVVIG
ncbi:MAG: hypothetical protein JWN62_2521, partial [Acidimicrobiales bacterium]|nr:hypothetical protein [Acidimicrobiales bacterium]